MNVVVLTDFSYANILNYCPFVNRDTAFSLSSGHFFDFHWTSYKKGTPFI